MTIQVADFKPDLDFIVIRHVGVGISVKDVHQFNLPLPARDMLPISIEEQLICYADSFFPRTETTFRIRIYINS